MDQVTIVNQALIRLGLPPIADLGENNRRARYASGAWDSNRDVVLAAHPWNFATRRASLALLSQVPTYGFAHAFALPTDFIRFDKSRDQRTDFRIELITQADNSKIKAFLTNESVAGLRYIARITDATLFDSLFADALSYKLSMELAKPLTGSDSVRAALEKSFNAALLDAQFVDSQQAPTDDISGGTWEAARYNNGQGDFLTRPLRVI